jgi:hypothetical protein
MARYRVVCTRQEPVDKSHHNAHIVIVGLGAAPAHYDRLMTVDEVWQAIAQGHTFYTQGPATGKVAEVERFGCRCGRRTLRSSADAVVDNNLDNLNACS